MSVAIDVAVQNVRLPLSRARVMAIARTVLRAERASDAHVSMAFVSTRAISSINWRYLQTRGATDVIAFRLAGLPGDARIVGDVYIAPDVARMNASVYGAGVQEELARLIVHGTLHVLGYDHPGGDHRMTSPMWARQEHLLRLALRRRVA